jgi:hypothetical protein
MARSTTAQRSTGRCSGRLDRPAQRHVPGDTASSPTPRSGSFSNDIQLSPPPESSADSPSPDLTLTTCWALLPISQREQFELLLSQLVLKAVGLSSLDIEETS